MENKEDYVGYEDQELCNRYYKEAEAMRQSRTGLGLGLSLLRPRERHRPAGVSLDVEMKFVSSTLASIQDWEGIGYDCRRIS